MRKYLFFLFAVVVSAISCREKQTSDAVSSPDGNVVARLWTDGEGDVRYSVTVGGYAVIDSSRLGVKRSDGDLTSGLRVVEISAPEAVDEQYKVATAKRRENRYQANRRVFRLRNEGGNGFDVIFQVANDGVAFRYFFPDIPAAGLEIQEEITSFCFPPHARGWLQPVAVAKSGWEQTNPSYEEHYEQGISVGTREPTGSGWVYPALFQVDSTWVLITEAGLDGRYCATRLRPESPGGEYRIGFPDAREVMPEGGLLPASDEPFHSPWRIITVGSLGTIVESNLGLDVADRAIQVADSLIKPGKASWSWINSKDDHITYEEQRKYIDFAADMGWQYCLIDVNWDRKIGYDRISDLARYAEGKGVGLLLWYNSAGSWNTVTYTPKDKLLTPEGRASEFARIRDMGIKGVKIDFFGGDGRSVIRYYLDILEDAARYGLLVNFHGATLPRGWSRTYPHLMTVEAVRGFEMVTFGQEDADRQAAHCTILPFTRNAFDPMDFTPMNLDRVRTHVQRRTTAAFELATSVLFVSGIQHYAESPEGMATVPQAVRHLLRDLPVAWDDVRFIQGFPGKEAVIARYGSNKWYVAGINGENTGKSWRIDPATFDGVSRARLFADGPHGGIQVSDIPLAPTSIDLKPNGGFVMVLE